jgi:hypothetical protein
MTNKYLYIEKKKEKEYYRGKQTMNRSIYIYTEWIIDLTQVQIFKVLSMN